MATTYRSNTSANTTLTLDFTEISRSGNNATYTVSWSVKLGSATSLGSSENRILYIYKNDGTLCGQSTIKNSTAWSSSGTYSGSFSVTVDVGTTNSGTVYLYGITNTTSISSCTWTNRNYCTDIAVAYSSAATKLATPTNLRIDSQFVLFNGTTTLRWDAVGSETGNTFVHYYVRERLWQYKDGAFTAVSDWRGATGLNGEKYNPYVANPEENYVTVYGYADTEDTSIYKQYSVRAEGSAGSNYYSDFCDTTINGTVVNLETRPAYFDGQLIKKIVLNGEDISHLNFNGSTVF